ncbi:MAG: VWA domain-containing protein [Candidatus Diapherotrites archaeon]
MEVKQLLHSKCTRSGNGSKGFAFTLDVVLALILFLGLIITAKSVAFSNPSTNLSKTQLMQLSHESFQAMDSTGFILTQIDANYLDSANQIHAKAQSLLPSNLDMNVSIKQYTAITSSTCRSTKNFSDCFPDANTLTVSSGTAIPANKELIHGRKIYVKKQPPADCNTSVQLSPAVIPAIPATKKWNSYLQKYFSNLNKPLILYFQSPQDLNLTFDVNVNPSNFIECDQNIDVNLSISVPSNVRKAVDMMLVIDRSGSMSWNGRVSTTNAQGLDIDGSYVYFADGWAGLRDINVLNPLLPNLVGTYNTPGTAYNVDKNGIYAYMADGWWGLRIVNVSNPASPSSTGSYNSPGTAYGVAYDNSYAYLADGGSGLQVVNVSNPANPSQTGNYNTPGTSYQVAVSGNYAYVADGTSGLRIVNITNKSNPTSQGSVGTSNAQDIVLQGNYAYVADGSAGLRVINVSNPSSPTISGTYNTPGTAYGIDIVDTNAYVADNTGGLQIIDVSNPAAPSLLRNIPTPYAFYDVRVSGNFAYLATNMGLITLDLINGTKMDSTKTSANSFIDFNEWKPRDQLGISSFNTSATLNSQLRHLDDANKNTLHGVINGLVAGGGTDIESGIRNATTELTSIRANPSARKFQVLLSDGQSTEGDSADAARDANTAGITIYTIGYGADASESELRNIANLTDGNYYFASDANALRDIYNMIALKIQEQASAATVFVENEGSIISVDQNAQIVDGNLIFTAGNIGPNSPWAGHYTVRFDCNTNFACEDTAITFPGPGSYFSYIDENGNTQNVPWDLNSTKTLPLKSRDLSIDIIRGEIAGENELYLDVNAANIGDLNTGATIVNFYVGQDSNCSTGSLLAPPSPLNVIPLCGAKNLDCNQFYVYWPSVNVASEGIICAKINEDKAIRECPLHNIDSINCYLRPKIYYYVLDYWVWQK